MTREDALKVRWILYSTFRDPAGVLRTMVSNCEFFVEIGHAMLALEWLGFFQKFLAEPVVYQKLHAALVVALRVPGQAAIIFEREQKGGGNLKSEFSARGLDALTREYLRFCAELASFDLPRVQISDPPRALPPPIRYLPITVVPKATKPPEPT